MSNIIGFSKAVFGKERISMSNQGTDCFLELLELAAAENNMTNNQRKLIVFLKERREENLSVPGTASFDVDEMPWSKDTLSEDSNIKKHKKTQKKPQEAQVATTTPRSLCPRKEGQEEQQKGQSRSRTFWENPPTTCKSDTNFLLLEHKIGSISLK